MKIVRKSNFDHDDYRGDQHFVAEDIKSERHAHVMCDALNEWTGENSEDFFEVVEDGYVLPPKWEP